MPNPHCPEGCPDLYGDGCKPECIQYREYLAARQKTCLHVLKEAKTEYVQCYGCEKRWNTRALLNQIIELEKIIDGRKSSAT